MTISAAFSPAQSLPHTPTLAQTSHASRTAFLCRRQFLDSYLTLSTPPPSSLLDRTVAELKQSLDKPLSQDPKTKQATPASATTLTSHGKYNSCLDNNTRQLGSQDSQQRGPSTPPPSSITARISPVKLPGALQQRERNKNEEKEKGDFQKRVPPPPPKSQAINTKDADHPVAIPSVHPSRKSISPYIRPLIIDFQNKIKTTQGAKACKQASKQGSAPPSCSRCPCMPCQPSM